ncbi:TRAP transporter small permease [Sneathiella glossodoripedis]|uniref:TRAP transporter small permease n=1 Tax=Sneathiella glossodoripedis TaxID=418853 RepID=UPI00046F00F6|nr:TRAP transporter small permease [Sneathiella glossodoripedis]
MRLVLNSLYKGGGLLGAFFILLIAVLVVAQVFLNMIDRVAGLVFEDAIGLTIPSYSDFTGFFLAASSFLALAYTLREGGHIRVTLVLQQLPEKIQHLAEIWCLVFVSAITIFATIYTGFLVHESWVYEDMSSGMVAVPIWIPQSSVLLGLAILSIALIDELITVLRGGAASYEGKGENLLEKLEEEGL